MIVFFILALALAAACGVWLARPLWKAGDKVRGLVAGIAAPVIALGLYLGVGAPDLARPGAAGLVDPAQAELEATIAELRSAAAAAPDDVAAWRRLAAAQLAVPDYAGAAEAFARLMELSPEDVSLKSAWAEALTMSRGGVVPADAREAFEAALAADPTDVRARYYLAEAKYQGGHPDEAIADWAALAESAGPGGAPWLATVARRLERAAQMQERSLDGLDISPETVANLERALRGDFSPRGPSAADVAAAGDMTAEQQQAMIEGMVGSLAARLEQNPDDIEGWRMLARSYAQLGRAEDQVRALAEIVRLAPEDLEARRNHAYALWVARTESGPPDAESIAALEDLLERTGDDGVALIGLAEAALYGGNDARATELLNRLLADDDQPPVLRQVAEERLAQMQAEAAEGAPAAPPAE